MKKKYFMNIECGNIFDFTECGYMEMMQEAAELYDLNDDTNGLGWNEYYTTIEV